MRFGVAGARYLCAVLLVPMAAINGIIHVHTDASDGLCLVVPFAGMMSQERRLMGGCLQLSITAVGGD